jgi:hypothetical protein
LNDAALVIQKTGQELNQQKQQSAQGEQSLQKLQQKLGKKNQFIINKLFTEPPKSLTRSFSLGGGALPTGLDHPTGLGHPTHSFLQSNREFTLEEKQKMKKSIEKYKNKSKQCINLQDQYSNSLVPKEKQRTSDQKNTLDQKQRPCLSLFCC